MKMRRIDHVVLAVSDLNRATRFYHEVFDMPIINDQTTDEVVTLRCGHQLIRLVTPERTNDLQAEKPTIGSADLCLVAGDQVEDIVHHFKSYYVDIVAGPIEKHGSEGAMTSIYIHDPDRNLIEVAVYTNK